MKRILILILFLLSAGCMREIPRGETTTSTSSTLADVSCTFQTNNSLRDKCLHQQAIEKENPELCDWITEVKEKNSCLTDLACKLRDLRICHAVIGYEEGYRCMFEVAEATDDPSACRSMTNPGWNERCVRKFIESNPDPELCEYMVDMLGLRSNCYKSVAAALKNATICDRITENTKRNSCRLEVSGGE